MLERNFQAGLIREIKDRIPGCVVLKNDANYLQGFPDISVIYGLHIGVLECKKSADEPHQPNQDYYVEHINEQGGFARFIYPENRNEVLDELQQSFGL